MAQIFLSYSSKDKEAAVKMFQWLTARGYSVFRDSDHILVGSEWEEQLYQNLKAAEVVIVLLSENSVDSLWCFAEMAISRMRGTKTIIPIVIGKWVKRNENEWTVAKLLGGHNRLDLTEAQEEGYSKLALKLSNAQLRHDFPWDRTLGSPYPGGTRFEGRHAGVFYGRDREIADVLVAVKDSNRITIVHGASGSGKSSLVRAGVLPRLAEDLSWEFLPPFETPDEVRKSLSKLDKLSAAKNKPVLITVDPLDEFLATEPSRQLLTSLLQVLNNSSPATLLLGTLRTSSWRLLDGDKALKTQLNRSRQIAIGPMSKDQIRRAIELPAVRAGIRVDDALLERMVDDATGDNALPLLAMTLAELHRRCGSELTESAYHDLGGLTWAIKSAAERIPQDETLISALTKLARKQVDGTVTSDSLSLDEFPVSNRQWLNWCVEARLLVSTTSKERLPTVSLAHTAVFEALGVGFDSQQCQDLLDWRRRWEERIADWERDPKVHKLLLPGGEVGRGRQVLESGRSGLRKREIEFIEKSTHWSKIRIGGAFALLLMLLILIAPVVSTHRAGSTIRRLGGKWDPSTEKATLPSSADLARAAGPFKLAYILRLFRRFGQLEITGDPERAVNLTGLDRLAALFSKSRVELQECQVSAVPQLADLANTLEWLDVTGSTISDLDVLTNAFVYLRYLNLESCRHIPRTLDVRQLPALVELNISGTRITNIIGLQKLESLEVLSAQRSELERLDELSPLQRLRWLDLSDSLNLKAVAGLGVLQNLQTVKIRRTQIAALPEIGRLNALVTLDISYTGIVALPGITNLKRLKDVLVSDPFPKDEEERINTVFRANIIHR